MKVYKFGGGVLSDSKSLLHLVDIVKDLSEDLLIVVSAFGKTTGALEAVLLQYYQGKNSYLKAIEEIEKVHIDLLEELGFSNKDLIYTYVKNIFSDLRFFLHKGLSDNKYFEYDRIVSLGELLSSNILTAFLTLKNIDAKFVDARKLLISDDEFSDAKIIWNLTEANIQQAALFDRHKIVVSQGFTACTANGETTTLGREGSDYTASVYAYCMNADEIVFWKNVNGVLNADPEKHPDAKLLKTLSYKEAVEQTFYGAKILHPKTIKPLENKKIPIQVRSFYNLKHSGTSISDISPDDKTFYPDIPVYIEKNNQILFSILSPDFSFISEYGLSKIFALLSKYRLKVSVMQNSAISFSFCVDNLKDRIPDFINELKKEYELLYNDNLTLITIRHYTDEVIKQYLEGREVLLRQLSRYTARFVVRGVN